MAFLGLLTKSSSSSSMAPITTQSTKKMLSSTSNLNMTKLCACCYKSRRKLIMKELCTLHNGVNGISQMKEWSQIHNRQQNSRRSLFMQQESEEPFVKGKSKSSRSLLSNEFTKSKSSTSLLSNELAKSKSSRSLLSNELDHINNFQGRRSSSSKTLVDKDESENLRNQLTNTRSKNEEFFVQTKPKSSRSMMSHELEYINNFQRRRSSSSRALVSEDNSEKLRQELKTTRSRREDLRVQTNSKSSRNLSIQELDHVNNFRSSSCTAIIREEESAKLRKELYKSRSKSTHF